MLEALQFEFMRHALMAGLLASIICGVMGTLVVVNRISFLSGGIAHAAYGGIGLALYMGWNFLFCTIGFSLGAGLLMALVSIKLKHRSDTIIGVIWALGMAFGIILVDLAPGYNVDLMSYLFGSILSVPAFDLIIMLVICLVTIGFVTFFYQGLIAFSYDEEFAQIRGVPVNVLYFTLIGILAVAIVMLIQVVGLILVIALLTIPPFIVEKYTCSLVQMMLASSFLGAIFTVSGLWLSYFFNLTSGASIILVAGGVFFLDILFDLFKKRFRRVVVMKN